MNLTFKKYRLIDIAIFSAILIVCEALCVVAINEWFKAELYTVSLVLTVVAITMMRWGALSVIHLIVGSLTTVIVSNMCGGIISLYHSLMIYVIGNLPAMLMLLFIKGVGKEKIASNFWLSAVYVIFMYVLMQVGKYLVALVFGQSQGSLLIYLSSEIISLLFAVIVVLLVRNLDGMFEDQKTYLFRMEKQRKEEQG